MAIAKANILTFVDKVLKTDFTAEGANSLDVEIQQTLDDLSEEDLLEASDTVTVNIDDETFAVPTGFRDFSALTPQNAAGTNLDPLIQLPGGIKQYRELKSHDTSNGIPEFYALFNDLVFMWKNANGTYIITREYTKDHAQDVDTIEFKDIFKNAINYGVTFEVSRRLNRTAGITLWGAKYAAAKFNRINNQDMQPSISNGDWNL